jgi:hypothetical protein
MDQNTIISVFLFSLGDENYVYWILTCKRVNFGYPANNVLEINLFLRGREGEFFQALLNLTASLKYFCYKNEKQPFPSQITS